MFKLTIYLAVVVPVLLGAIACFLVYHFSRVRWTASSAIHHGKGL